jgi:hypothetical protein
MPNSRPAKQRDVDLDKINARINDPSWAVDRTGVTINAIPHQQQDIKKFPAMMPSTKRLQCPNCKGDRFLIFSSTIDEAVQFRCGNVNCMTWWKPMGLHKLQMTDAIAKSLGIWLPSPVPDAMYQDLEGWEDGRFTDLEDEQERNRR